MKKRVGHWVMTLKLATVVVGVLMFLSQCIEEGGLDDFAERIDRPKTEAPTDD